MYFKDALLDFIMQIQNRNGWVQDGIVKVWTDNSRKDSPFKLPGTAFDFFTDMHRQDLPHQLPVLPHFLFYLVLF